MRGRYWRHDMFDKRAAYAEGFAAGCRLRGFGVEDVVKSAQPQPQPRPVPARQSARRQPLYGGIYDPAESDRVWRELRSHRFMGNPFAGMTRGMGNWWMRHTIPFAERHAEALAARHRRNQLKLMEIQGREGGRALADKLKLDAGHAANRAISDALRGVPPARPATNNVPALHPFSPPPYLPSMRPAVTRTPATDRGLRVGASPPDTDFGLRVGVP